MQECEKLGIPYGAYLYSYALNTRNAESEADHAIRVADKFNPSLGIWIDMEDSDGYKEKNGINAYEERELITKMCNVFCGKVASKGYRTGVYSNKSYFENVINIRNLSYPIWLAHWGADKPSMDCLIWQYTSNGSVDGVFSEKVDMDYYYGELPDTGIEQPDENTGGETKYKVGDKVSYTKIYESSTSDKPLKPDITRGVITKVIAGRAHPYLINDGTGWVDEVSYTKIYESSTSDKPLKPDITRGVITKVIAGRAHPYLINDGTGWVDDDSIDSAGSTPFDIKKGDRVKVLNAVQYDNGKRFDSYYDVYDVIEVDGDRVVIGIKDIVTAAVAAKNLKKAGY